MILESKFHKDYRAWLQSKFDDKKAINQRFSLRSFAHQIGIAPTTISEVLAGKRHPSSQSTQKIADFFKLNDLDRKALVDDIKKQSAPAGVTVTTELTADIFREISDWYHYAILELASIEDTPKDPARIAERLDIRVSEARDAIARLRRHGFVKIDGNFIKPSPFNYLRKIDGTPSSVVRKQHKQFLNLAIKSIEKDPVDTRDFGSLTIAIDQKQLPEAKKAIADFRSTMLRLLSGGKKDEVYTLSVQFFPITKRRSKHASR